MKTKTLSDVSLVCTVYNEHDSIVDFLKSVFRMTVLPAEFVIVDGGSSDGTERIISDYVDRQSHSMKVHLLRDPQCNILFTPSPVARGRNIAIRYASGSIIACTDAGCIIEPQWLENITLPLRGNRNIDVVGGWYRPEVRNFFEKCVGIVWMVPQKTASTNSFIPSSRSLAFRKSAWEAVRGYPEFFLWGEDTSFALNLRKKGYKFHLALDAVVRWRVCPTPFEFAKMVYEYGMGDGYHQILLVKLARNILKLLVAVILIVLGTYVSPWYLLVLMLYWWLLPLNKKLDEIKIQNIAKFPVLSALKLISDIGYSLGYFGGMRRRISSGKAANDALRS